MDTAAQHTDMAEVYVKRWEPHEEREASGSVYDELARILLTAECRDELRWFDEKHYCEFFPLQAVYTLRKAC